MDASNSRRYEMLTRVAEFGVAHREVFPASEVVGELFAAVRKTVEATTASTRPRGPRGRAQSGRDQRARPPRVLLFASI